MRASIHWSGMEDINDNKECCYDYRRETTTLTPRLFPMIDMDTAANAIPTEKEPSEANATALGG
jgi:hypothetical protein